jgi:hypothetical protein
MYGVEVLYLITYRPYLAHWGPAQGTPSVGALLHLLSYLPTYPALASRVSVASFSSQLLAGSLLRQVVTSSGSYSVRMEYRWRFPGSVAF